MDPEKLIALINTKVYGSPSFIELQNLYYKKIVKQPIKSFFNKIFKKRN